MSLETSYEEKGKPMLAVNTIFLALSFLTQDRTSSVYCFRPMSASGRWHLQESSIPNDGYGPFATSDTKGGKQSFALSAKLRSLSAKADIYLSAKGRQ
jgi:hypothetical protein